MSACGPRDPGVTALTTSRGSAPPLLPMLVTAIAISALSLLCRAPATETPSAPVATAQASLPGADGFHPALSPVETIPAIPSALAFSRMQPPMLHLAEVDETGKAPAVRPVRPTVAARRPCAGPRCGETRRVDTAVRTAPARVKAAAEPAAIPDAMRGQSDSDEDLLPTGTLPFAATAASWVEKVRKLGGNVGTGAASLGGSVVDLLASAR